MPEAVSVPVQHTPAIYPELKVTMIGAGNLGSAISIKATDQTNPILDSANLTIVGASSGRAQKLAQSIGATGVENDYRSVAESKVVFICCKPKDLAKVLEGILPHLKPDTIIISTVPTESFERYREILSDKGKLVLCIPNPAFEFGGSLNIVRFDDQAKLSSQEVQIVQALVDSGGTTYVCLPERPQDLAVGSAITACGPAFVAHQVLKFARDLNLNSEYVSRRFRLYCDGAELESNNRIDQKIQQWEDQVVAAAVDSRTTVEAAKEFFQGAVRGYVTLFQQGLSETEIIASVATPGGITEAALQLAANLDTYADLTDWKQIVTIAVRRISSTPTQTYESEKFYQSEH